MNSSIIIIIVVVAFAFYLIYSQNSQPKYVVQPQQQISGYEQVDDRNRSTPCTKCEEYKNQLAYYHSETDNQYHYPQPAQYPSQQNTKIIIESEADQYSDPIKRQDYHSMHDILSYPQLRLPREILEKYNEYYERTGTYPPFDQATQPLFDNPILNGLLIKQPGHNDLFHENIPSTVPLFRIKSTKNSGRFFYYIIDQRTQSKLELKIPLDNIKLNGTRYSNAEYSGLPEIYDDDMIENIPGYPGAKFKVLLYKTHHFP